jgi:hypothetical protein
VNVYVRHIAGGRVDMEFSFPGFNLHVELKVDSSKTPVGDKKSYLGQSAAYQVADKRIGFLLVLKLLPGKKQLAAWLGDALEVVTVPDGSTDPRIHGTTPYSRHNPHRSPHQAISNVNRQAIRFSRSGWHSTS